MYMEKAELNAAQREVLDILACFDKEEDLTELKNVLVRFLNERLQKELEALRIENGQADDSSTPRTKQELEDDFVEALEDLKRYKAGKVEFRAAEELIDEL